MVLGASRPHFSKGDSRANPGLSDTRSVAGCRSSLEARLHIHNSQIYRGSVRGSTKHKGKRALQKPNQLRNVHRYATSVVHSIRIGVETVTVPL